jgi:hypothetical protein
VAFGHPYGPSPLPNKRPPAARFVDVTSFWGAKKAEDRLSHSDRLLNAHLFCLLNFFIRSLDNGEKTIYFILSRPATLPKKKNVQKRFYFF